MTLDSTQMETARAILRVALSHLNEMPHIQRADVYDLGGLLLEGSEAEDAASAAHHLREFEKLQNRLFENL